MKPLLKLLPAIRRTRGNRLYTKDGRRYLDLWLDDGHKLLSGKEAKTRTRTANAMDKGLELPYPGMYERRLKKELCRAWPGYPAVKIFSYTGDAILAAASILQQAAEAPYDTAFTKEGHSAGRFFLARPFVSLSGNAELIMPRIPCPAMWAPACLMAKEGSQAEKALAKMDDSLIAPLCHIAGARALASVPGLVNVPYTEKEWEAFAKPINKWFYRNGPYLLPKAKGEAYEALFIAAMEGGVLIAPRPDAPSVIPLEWDKGELAKLVSALKKL
ncbi:hypothetical protein MASR2M29_15940 [Spirochaetota bacterium]